MVSNSTRLPDVLRRALQATGLPWHVQHHKRHRAIVLAGAQVGVLHFGASRNRGTDGYVNIVAAIKRRARQVRQ